jgi:hypothetical protein
MNSSHGLNGVQTSASPISTSSGTLVVQLCGSTCVNGFDWNWSLQAPG